MEEKIKDFVIFETHISKYLTFISGAYASIILKNVLSTVIPSHIFRKSSAYTFEVTKLLDIDNYG